MQLPAGVIEQGETVEQLAVRELKEETGEAATEHGVDRVSASL